MEPPRFQIDWASPSGDLRATEPTLAEVTVHATILAAAYNDPHNAPLMGHAEPISPTEVVDHYEAMFDDGARPFLFFHQGQFAGDGDLRGFEHGAAEFAFMVAATAAQGKGLGTRFAIMLHTFGFANLGLHHIYASIVPANTGSRRVFEKLGYHVDTSPEGREFSDAEGDIVMSIDRATFERQHAPAMAEIRIAVR